MLYIIFIDKKIDVIKFIILNYSVDKLVMIYNIFFSLDCKVNIRIKNCKWINFDVYNFCRYWNKCNLIYCIELECL